MSNLMESAYPSGKIAETKRKIYDAIKKADIGGFDHNSVWDALQLYAEEYHLEMVIKAFHETPLRWYPSGNKVYNWRFRFILICKKIVLRLKFLYWRYIK